LKITGLKATPINIPLEKPLWWTGGLYPGTSKTIIEVETDQGLIGLGEAPSVDVVEAIRRMGEVLIGADPLDAPDYIVTNFAVLGGISRTVRFIGACEAMGVGFWCYSGDAGITTAAYLHMSVAMPWITEPSQSLFRWQVGDVMEGGPFQQQNNVISVPEGTGLGVTLDRKALSVWHKHFEENGALNHFHDPGFPGQFRTLPLH